MKRNQTDNKTRGTKDKKDKQIYFLTKVLQKIKAIIKRKKV